MDFHGVILDSTEFLEYSLGKLYHMTPGQCLKMLSASLLRYIIEHDGIWQRIVDLDFDSKVKVIYIIEAIVYYAMVKTVSSKCLAEVPLSDIQMSRRLIAIIKSLVQDSPLLTENLADRCLAVLVNMKNLDKNVSILLTYIIYIQMNYSYLLIIFSKY